MEGTDRYAHTDKILSRPTRFAEDFTPGSQVLWMASSASAGI